jgi:hypothetical protein
MSMVGKTYEVLVEGPSKKNDDVLSSYASNGKLINFKGPAYLTGCLVPVKVLGIPYLFAFGRAAGGSVDSQSQGRRFLDEQRSACSTNISAWMRAIRNDPRLKLGDDLVAMQKEDVPRDLAIKPAMKKTRKPTKRFCFQNPPILLLRIERSLSERWKARTSSD